MRSLRSVFSVAEMRARARRRLPRMVFDFIDGGADDEITLRDNEDAFARTAFAPRVAANVRTPSTAIELLGTTLALPLVLAPTGMPALAHPAGELAAVRAARAAGILFTASTVSSYAAGRIAAAAPGPHWFQLYAWRDRELAGALIDRAREAGYQALLLTVDTPIVGNRERDVRNGTALPPRLTPANAADLLGHPGWLWGQLRGPNASVPNIAGLAAPTKGGFGPAGYLKELFNPELAWDDLAWIKARFGGPVGVKGIMTAADALRARGAGADLIVVSNHGGRQLDGAPASLDILPEVVAALAGSGLPILLDGGVRRGSDIVKALALGATACLIGRAWLWGLAGGGEAGVARVIEILRTELERTLVLVGEHDVRNLTPDAVRLKWSRSATRAR